MVYNVITELIVNILRVFLLKKAMDLFLSVDESEEKRLQIGAGAYYVVTAAMYCIFQISVIYEVCSFLGITLLTFLYPGTWKKRIWVALVLFGMDMACSLAVLFAFAQENLIQLPAIQALLLLICAVIISHIFNYRGRKDLSAYRRATILDTGQLYVLAVIPAISIFILWIMLYGEFEGVLAVLICAAMLLINLSVFYLYHVMLENYIHLRENDLYRQQTYAYQNQLEVIMESQKHIRALKHDMKNHMLALQALLRKNDGERAQEYLNAMQDFMANPSEYAATGNDAVDSLLNYKIQRANDILNVVETKIKIPERLILHSFDLNVVLGNLLDNAIEASVQSEGKRLKLSMVLEKGILFINIWNSCLENSDGKRKRWETTKADKANHGIGLQNVQRIVEKYHGDMELTCENGHMEVDIMMYISEM